MKAFMVIRTVSDLLTAMDVMRAGYRLGVMAEPGHLYGPPIPVRLMFEWTDRSPFTIQRFTNATMVNLADFLAQYLSDTRVIQRLGVDAASDREWIERVWRHLNYSAGMPLSRLVILELVMILAEYVGGTCEPQMTYGDPEWVEFAKRKLGPLQCWSQPGPDDLRALIALGVPLINAANLDGLTGMVGCHPMPEHGVIRDHTGMTTEAAYDASGAPTGFGPEWDTIARRTRLLGLPVTPEWPLKIRQGLEQEARVYARKKRLDSLSRLVWVCEGQGDPTRDGNPLNLTLMRLPQNSESLSYLNHNWSSVIRADFET